MQPRVRGNFAKFLCGALTAAAVFAGPKFVQAADPLLRWKFTKGESLKYALKLDMTQSMNLGGNPVNIEMNQTIDMDWTVDDVDADGNAMMTQKITRMKLDMKTGQPGGDVSIDSDNKEGRVGLGQMLAPMIDGLVNQPVTMKVSPLGETSDIKVSQEMLDALTKTPGAAGMGGLFSEDSVKQMMSHGMLKLPEAPATTGKHWSDTMTTKLPTIGTQTVETTYTFKGTETRDGDELAKLGMTQEQAIESDPAAQIKVGVDKQTSDGTVLFDVAAGHVQSIDHESVVEMAIEAGGMQIGQTVTTHMTMTLGGE